MNAELLYKPFENRIALLLSSYRHWLQRDLIAGWESDLPAAARNLWEAPFVVVSHGTEPDPIFWYGNQAALRAFGMSWEEFTALPSRFSAEPVNREERARLLERVTRYGYIDNYAGVRIAKSGVRFHIENAVVWNLIDPRGNYQGQAATFAAP